MTTLPAIGFRRPTALRRVMGALLIRELSALAASRIGWVFGIICLAGGLAVALGTVGDRTALWFSLPLLLYLLPLLGLLTGVSAAHADRGEEALLAHRVPRPAARAAAKWFVWTVLLALVSLVYLVPVAVRAGDSAASLVLWGYAVGEISVFVALGLALGRWIRDGIAAHLTALLAGFVFLVGIGLLAWLAARTPFFQDHPDLWTLGLMLHPVEALRVGLMATLDGLPFATGQLPPLSTWWLEHPGFWYILLVFGWTAFGLAAARGSGRSR